MSTIRLPEIEWECVLFLETADGTELTVYSDCTASTKGEAELWCEGLSKRMKMSLVGCEAMVKGTSQRVTAPTERPKQVIALPAPVTPPAVVPPEPFFDKAYFTKNEDRPVMGGSEEASYD